MQMNAVCVCNREPHSATNEILAVRRALLSHPAKSVSYCDELGKEIIACVSVSPQPAGGNQLHTVFWSAQTLPRTILGFLGLHFLVPLNISSGALEGDW